MNRRYPRVIDGQIYYPVMSPDTFHHQCCDCGLVHDVQLDVTEDGRILWAWIRNRRRTAAVRRNRHG